jgi:hypothetical protein
MAFQVSTADYQLANLFKWQLVDTRKPPSSAGLQSRLQFTDMLFRRGSDLKTIDARTSDVFERIQRIEAEQSALRAEIEGARQLRFRAVEIVGAAQATPVIGSAVENFAQAMRARLPRGRAGGLARSSTAWRRFDGTFMPASAKLEARHQEYERYASGGRAGVVNARRAVDGTFLSNSEGFRS